MSYRGVTRVVSLAVAAAVAASAPALAQKSKNALRSTTDQPVSVVDRVYNAQPATTLISKAIFDPIIMYDPVKREYKPLLASSWRQIDETTWEFKLRNDVKFHDGSKFDADDVVFFTDHVIDPKNNFRFKGSRYGWIKGVEKVDSYTVRIMSKGPFAPAIARMSGDMLGYPSDSFGKDPHEFGKHPIGTGPYKAAEVDPGSGVVLVRNTADNLAASWRPAGKLDRIHITSAPDQQTQVARMMVGEQDLMYHVPSDQAKALAANPNFKIFVKETTNFAYVQYDSADRSKIGILANEKVRVALDQAYNRKLMQQALLPPQAEDIPLPDGMCHKWIVACDYHSKPLPYNAAATKRGLAAAGYPDGFPVQVLTWGNTKEIAEAVVGDLRAVGVKASLDYVTYGVYSKKRSAGQFQILVSSWDNGGGQPDIDTTMGFFYLPSARDYMQDKENHALAKATSKEFDAEKRKALVSEILNRVNDKHYLTPLIQLPAVVVHNKDLMIDPGQMSPEGFLYNYVSWKM